MNTPIVAASDFSPSADLAVERAAKMAQHLQCELRLLHVFNDSIWASVRNVYDLERWLGGDPTLGARERLSQQASDLSRRFGIEVVAHTLHGDPTEQISAHAVAANARLLVLGESGESLLGEMLLGGTAQKILDRARLPVLVVRTPVSENYARVLVASDFSAASRHAAQLALDFCAEAQHLLLHAYVVPMEGRMRMAGATDEDINRYRDQELERSRVAMQEFLRGIGGAYSHRLVHGFPVDSILEGVKRNDIDLLVLGKHAGGVLGERLLGSVPQNVLHHVSCDVMLVPPL